jgi:hypothetical protein
MNNSLFAPGSALCNAFNDIFKTEARDAEGAERIDAAVPVHAAPDNKETCSDVT